MLSPSSLKDFEWSWESGEVLLDWKLVNVVPVFKKGKKNELGNYRTASLSSAPCEVIEEIILVGFEKHLEDNAVIGPSQHSSVRGTSCLANMISFCDKEKRDLNEQ